MDRTQVADSRQAAVAAAKCAAALPIEPVRLKPITIRLMLARKTDPNDPDSHLCWTNSPLEGVLKSYTERPKINLTH